MDTDFRSRGRTIMETDLILYSMITKDWADIHTDREFVSRTVHGRLIAHGGLALALGLGLSGAGRPGSRPHDMSSIFFRKPAFVGDTVHLELARGDGPNRRALRIVNQFGEPVIETSQIAFGT